MLPPHVQAECQRIADSVALDTDPSKLFGVRRTGMGVKAYMQMLRLDPCAYCGRWPVCVEIDHIQPRSDGGANHWSNYTAACGGCNMLKCDDWPLHWLWRFRFELPEFVADYMARAA